MGYTRVLQHPCGLVTHVWFACTQHLLSPKKNLITRGNQFFFLVLTKFFCQSAKLLSSTSTVITAQKLCFKGCFKVWLSWFQKQLNTRNFYLRFSRGPIGKQGEELNSFVCFIYALAQFICSVSVIENGRKQQTTNKINNYCVNSDAFKKTCLSQKEKTPW